MKIKNLILSASLAFTMCSVTVADQAPVLDVMVPSGKTGSTMAQSVLINNALIELGYDSKLVHTGNCVNAVNYMNNNTERPTIFLYSDNRYYGDKKKFNCNIVAKDDNFVVNFNLKLSTMCVRADTDFTTFEDFIKNKDRVTIATTNTLPGSPYTDLSKQFGVDFVRVDFDGTKKTTAALVASDTDMMYQRYTGYVANHPEVKCFTTSASKAINGMPPMTEVFPEWSLNQLGSIQTVMASNLTREQLENAKNVIIQIQSENDKLRKYLADSYMVTAGEMDADGFGLAGFLENVQSIIDLDAQGNK